MGWIVPSIEEVILERLAGLALAASFLFASACEKAEIVASATILERGEIAQSWNTVVAKGNRSFLHYGVDIETTPAAAVKAPRSATVTFAGWRPGYGHAVFLSDDNGNEFRFGHLASTSVSEGQHCEPGEIVGFAEPKPEDSLQRVLVHVEYRPLGQRPVNPEIAIRDLLFRN
jgi:murein DD-endopeptidase MepM/ murein hydrolase activator NlpD